MDLFEDESPAKENAPEFSVSEISGAVRKTLEGAFGRVRVRGEIGRVSKAGSGHVYFDLKDDKSVLASVAWRGVAVRLEHLPEEGMEMIATGRITSFPGQSRYQLIVDDLRPAGVGALMAMLEARKKALAAEGLFADERKRPLPFLPEIIGVVTSPQGAVIRDILHRLRERYPRKVLVWPVAVQGKACAPEVARAIKGFNELTPGGALPRPDLLIVARGGGSVEDLWGFNEEAVARAAAASQIPLISAVGHETDTTLIDFVSDKRAPTPTAAAEIAVPVRAELAAWVAEQGARLTRSASQTVERRRQRLSDLGRALPRPEVLLNDPRQRLDRAEEKLSRALFQMVERKRSALTTLAAGVRPSQVRSHMAQQRTRLADWTRRLTPALAANQRRKSELLSTASTRLRAIPTNERIQRRQQDLSGQTAAMETAFQTRLRRMSDRVEALDRVRRSLGYTATLARGYAVVRAGDTVVTTTEAAKSAGALDIEFSDGRIEAQAGGAQRSAPKPKKSSPNQGSLF